MGLQLAPHKRASIQNHEVEKEAKLCKEIDRLTKKVNQVIYSLNTNMMTDNMRLAQVIHQGCFTVKAS